MDGSTLMMPRWKNDKPFLQSARRLAGLAPNPPTKEKQMNKFLPLVTLALSRITPNKLDTDDLPASDVFRQAIIDAQQKRKDAELAACADAYLDIMQAVEKYKSDRRAQIRSYKNHIERLKREMDQLDAAVACIEQNPLPIMAKLGLVDKHTAMSRGFTEEQYNQALALPAKE